MAEREIARHSTGLLPDQGYRLGAVSGCALFNGQLPIGSLIEGRANARFWLPLAAGGLGFASKDEFYG